MPRNLIRSIALVIATLATVLVAAAAAPAGAEDVDDRIILTDLVASPTGTSVAGEAVTLTISATPLDGGPPELVTGSVRIFDVYRGVRSEVAELPLAGGGAQLVTTSLLPGRHALTASLVPHGDLVPGRSNGVVHRVRPAACPTPGGGEHGAVVQLVYTNLLGRCPDRAGFDHWVARLAGGTPPVAFARVIALTPEAVGRVVDDAYRTMLGRSADPSGRAFWVGRLRRHGRYDQLLADLGASQEFWVQAGGTDEGFVTRIYARILDRAPDRWGFDYWVERSGLVGSRRELILLLANQDEPLDRLVTLAYEEILGRAPTHAERADGVAHLRSTGDRSRLYAQLLADPEFSALA